MTRARDVSDQGWIERANPSLIINGGFDVWQRGTSFTGTGYTADRWTVTTTTSTVDKVTGTGDFPNALKVTSGATTPRIFNPIELPSTGFGGVFRNGNVFTVSLYARAQVDMDLTIYLYGRDSSSSGTNESVLATSSAIPITTAWAKYTTTLTLNADVNPTNTSVLLSLNGSVAANWMEITGVKLEQGSVATPWFYEDYGTTLRKCQRYYEVLDAVQDGFMATGSVSRGNFTTLYYKAQKRIAPTISFSFDDIDGNLSTTTPPAADDSTIYSCSISFGALASGRTRIRIRNFTADAEL